MSNEIKRISTPEMGYLIAHYQDKDSAPFLRGKFFAIGFKDGDPSKPFYTAADNSSGDCYVEEFDTDEKARFWLEKETYNKEEVENHFKREAIEEGCKDFLVDCTVTLTKAVFCKAKSKEDAERIVDRAWDDGYISVDWDDDPTNTVEVYKGDIQFPIRKGDTYFRELTDGSVEEVVQR